MFKDIFFRFYPLVTLTIGSVGLSVILPFWINQFGDNIGGPYFIVVLTSLISALFFGGLFLFFKFIQHVPMVSFRKYWVNYVIRGLINTLTVICIVYSSPIERTPPILVLVISSMCILFGIVLTKIIIKKSINYRHWCPITSLILLLISLILLIVGQITYNLDQNKFNYYVFIWIVICLLGFFFSSLYNVAEEKYITDSNPSLESDQQKRVNLFVTLFWTSVFQMVGIICFFWVDLLPFFGFSTINDFLPNLRNSILCFFVSAGCDYRNLLFGLSYIASYIITYVSTILLNRKSANFGLYAYAIGTPISSLIFLVCKFGTASTPLWAVIPSIVILLSGILIWKYWEDRIVTKPKQSDIETPSPNLSELDKLEDQV
jgi:hypothetical protein